MKEHIGHVRKDLTHMSVPVQGNLHILSTASMAGPGEVLYPSGPGEVLFCFIINDLTV